MDCHPTTIASHAFIEASIKHSLEIKGYKSKNIMYNRELVSSIFFFAFLPIYRKLEDQLEKNLL